ncbi:MAG: dTDP-4-dehydrorhamnose reductase [Nitrospirota bacterium]
MRILITGADGQLAREFLRNLEGKSNYQVTALSKKKLDVSDANNVLEALLSYKSDIVLNCSGYNLVDKAEEDFDTAFKVNALGVKNLAAACKKNKSLLVHYSTDYVFDGTKEDFYTEDDEPNPINNYGKSKLSGEKLLTEETDNFLLFRVSWVFGEGRQNFLYKLSEWAPKNRIIRIVCDQISIPTYTEDIVKFTLLAIGGGLHGVYHLTNSGYASRYEVARYFTERLCLDNQILPVTSDYFPAAAKRPYFSAMSNGKLSKVLNNNIPHWKDGIDRFIKRLER